MDERMGVDSENTTNTPTIAWQDEVFSKWEEMPSWRKTFNRNYPDYEDSVQAQDLSETGEVVYHLSTSIEYFLRSCRDAGLGLSDDILDAKVIHKALMAFDFNQRNNFLVTLAALMKGDVGDQTVWKEGLDALVQHPLFLKAQEVGTGCGDRDNSAGTQATIKSFSEPFIGKSHDRLWNHITKSKDVQFECYANICAIVQSSGMGKSRTVDELGKKCIVISICLRREGSGYPPADKDLRDFLTLDTPNSDVARGRCYAVLIGLLQHTLAVLKGANISSEIKLRQWFHERMSWSHGTDAETESYRRQFFQSVITIAGQYDEAVKKASPRNSPKRPQRVSKVDGNLEISQSPQVPDTKDRSSQALLDSIRALVNHLNGLKGSRQSSDSTRVVIAFDEAHTLSGVGGVIKGSKGIERRWTTFTTLREAFRACREESAVWGLFLSTTGKLLQFNPPSSLDPSERVAEQMLFTFPPFTALQYDIFAPTLSWIDVDDGDDGKLIQHVPQDRTSEPSSKKARIEEDLDLQRISSVAFLAKFGRPMFALRYDLGEEATRAHILNFAIQKLICNDPSRVFARQDQLNLSVAVAIACLSQRLCLEFDMESYNTQEDHQIAAHMRLCLKIGPDNQYIMSSSGSEPLLAEAAALVMMHPGFLPAHNLKKVFSGFGLSKGLRGETVAMLAVTVARDAAVYKNITDWCKDRRDIKLADVLSGVMKEDNFKGIRFRIVGVVDFLRKLLLTQDAGNTSTGSAKGKGMAKNKYEGEDGEEYNEYSEGEEDGGNGAEAGREGEGEEKVREEEKKLNQDGRLSNASLYFNHFIKPLQQSTCTLTCLMGYMTRGAALLCANNHRAVDFILPMLFGEALELASMSFVLVQVKNDSSIRIAKRKELFASMDLTVHSLFSEVKYSKPVVRIVFSLRAKKELRYEWTEFDIEGTSYLSLDIWCGGISFNRRGEAEESWMALTHTTSKICKGAESMAPGAALFEEFWQWIQNFPPTRKTKDSKQKGKQR